MEHQGSCYDDFALQYAKLVAAREKAGIEHDPIMPRFLKLLGDVSGFLTLDAGCGEGYVSSILTRFGARVTGIDISASLIKIARSRHGRRRGQGPLLSTDTGGVSRCLRGRRMSVATPARHPYTRRHLQTPE